MAKPLSLPPCPFVLAVLTSGTLATAALAAFASSGIAQLQFDELGAHLPPESGSTFAVALGDVDGDGDPDLVLGDTEPGRQNRLYLNDGTGTFTDVTAARLPPDRDRTTCIALGDVDGDGDPDLVFGNLRQNRLYLNDGTGTFNDATADRLPPHSDDTFVVALGDVDIDGDLDLVFGTSRGQNRLYCNDGTGTFTDATADRMPLDGDDTLAMALGDVDGDGDLDLVFGNSVGQQNRLYLNDGRGTFTDATDARMPIHRDVTHSVALGDVDGDGDPDLALGDSEPGQRNRLYLNNGTGTFSDVTDARMPPDGDNTWTVVFGDVDGDGDLDLVLGNFAEQQNRIYFNLHRQLDTPSRPVVTETFAMDFYAKPGYGTSFHTVIPALSLALAPMPLSLPPLGDLYLGLNGVINLPWVTIPPSTGRGTLEVTVCPDPSLVGSTLYVQGLIVNNARPYGDSHLTNYTADLIIE